MAALISRPLRVLHFISLLQSTLLFRALNSMYLFFLTGYAAVILIKEICNLA